MAYGDYLDEDIYNNEAVRARMNTVQPGMEERQGTAPRESNPTSIQAPGATDVRDAQGNLIQRANGQQDFSGMEKRQNEDGSMRYVTGTTVQDTLGGPAKTYMDVLRQYEYGPEGLAKAENELKEMGIQLQKDSNGAYRGRMKLANGDIVDVVAGGEGNDWWNNKTGEAWGNLNRGQEGLDAGGWSFGGGGSESPSGMGDIGGNSIDRINALVPTDQSTYQTLMANMQRIIGGPQATDRNALMDLMNR